MAGALVACNVELAAPACALCNELEVRVGKEAYSPGSWVAFTVRNLTNEDRRYDWCSVAPRRRMESAEAWDVVRRTGDRCPGALPADVAANIRLLAAGASVQDSVLIRTSAYQGEYRVLVWLVLPDGQVVTGNPVFSNAFDVLPSAP